MQRQLAAFVEQPCQTTFLAAREAVLSYSPLPLSTADMLELNRLLSDGQFERLLDRLDTLPPSKVLSPRIHFLAAEAAEALGRADDVELERSLFVLTLQGLLATGDGSAASPYIVCHATDEQDLLATLGFERAGQSLVQHHGRLIDVLLCRDGRQVCFDVTDLLSPKRPKKRRKMASARRRAALRRLPAGRFHR